MLKVRTRSDLCDFAARLLSFAESVSSCPYSKDFRVALSSFLDLKTDHLKMVKIQALIGKLKSRFDLLLFKTDLND